MSNHHQLPFHIMLGRSNQDQVDIQALIGGLQNLATRPVLEQVQNQNAVALSRWLRFQRPTSRSVTENEIIREAGGNSVGDVVVDLTGTNNETRGTPTEAPRNDQPVNNQPQTPRTASSPIAGLNLLIEQNPDISRAIKLILSCIPFIILIILKETYEHLTDILVTAGLIITFIHSNNSLEREVSKQVKRELKPLGITLFNCTTCILFVYFIYGEEELQRSLMLYPHASAGVSLLALLWTNITIDHVLKLMTIIIKTIITALPPSLIPFLRKGKYFVFTETSSQLYRALATVPPWIHYLFSNHRVYTSDTTEGAELLLLDRVVEVILCALYLICKAYKTTKIVKAWQVALIKLFQSSNYGSSPTAEQLLSAGSTCPICHDEYKTPTCLQCRHIFCEECVALWLDRERTCPMCRATVAEDPKWKDGSTDPFIQLF